jgi:hypothetical protein
MRHTAESIFKIEYLREYEFIFETALAHESGDPAVLIAEKTESRKSCGTVTLRLHGHRPLYNEIKLCLKLPSSI